ncbi:aminoglycoside phosphotransferase family protein [Cellulomonas sp. NS3]|uniref:aminoglycoside phosphotransferase family protein n=1 Tax=Cellulomonas sp. NS3 TaxID=2973977 RepID=UPI002161DC78|nr:aminoglycoside phosphotransferase family protein [Cellulomonas sp. NS3]
MADRPAADVDVSVDLVRALLRDQHPDLADLGLRVVASGWDNVVLRLGDRLAVRVPRRPEAVALVLHEQRWLPEIARRLDVATPVPVRVGVPSDRLGRPWSVVPWFPGVLASGVPPERRGPVVAPLARFLAALHVPAPAGAPANPVRGVPLRARATAVRERLATGLVPRSDEVAPLWAAAVAATPWTRPASWVHGDLHPANLLVTAQRDLAAVLDFGDLTAGDPATDLATAWLTFAGPARAELRALLDATGRYDDATWVRAHGWALCMATALLVTSDDDEHLAAIGAHALHEALDDPA